MDIKVKGTREMKKLLVAISAAMAGLAACAATTITVDNVRQRWPWNNKVDITYTIAGDDATVDKVCRVVITTVVGGVTYTAYDGVPSVNVLPGTYTVTWANPPAGVKCDGCKMTAKFYTVDVPSGNDYMIVDLTTGAVSYEGRFANGDTFGCYSGQHLSNARYNVDRYKSTHMALRKIPAGTYKAKRGTSEFKEWTTDKDYYIGIFCWTTAQYGYIIKRTNGQDATNWTDYSTKSRRWRPDQIRGNTDPAGAVPTYASVDAAISAAKWRPIELINAKTGMNFDIPTELMHEIACRAGTTTTYFWGNSASYAKQYAVFNISGRNTNSQYADPPGTKDPNGWGLYDMVGNDWQWCRTRTDEGEPPDVFTPATGTAANWYVRGGNLFDRNATDMSCDRRSSAPAASGTGYSFRAAYIVPSTDPSTEE